MQKFKDIGLHHSQAPMALHLRGRVTGIDSANNTITQQ